MFFEGHHSIELGCPMLLNYLNNIGNIGDSEQAAPYQACLATLDEQVQELDTLWWADVTAVTGIEIFLSEGWNDSTSRVI